MIVCVCNAIREKDVHEAARCGARNARGLFRHANRRPKCAQCISYAETILAQAHAPA